MRSRSLGRRRRARGAEAGVGLVEIAVSLPVLVLLVVGTADFGRIFYYAIELTNAARAGAQYAGYNSVQATKTAEITAAAQSAAPNIGSFSVTLSTPPNVCKCAQDSGSGQPWTAVTCNTVCPVGLHMFETVTVTATKRFSTISRFPGIPNTLTLSRTATMRVAL